MSVLVFSLLYVYVCVCACVCMCVCVLPLLSGELKCVMIRIVKGEQCNSEVESEKEWIGVQVE